MAEFAELPAPMDTRFGPVRVVPETGSTNADLLAEARQGAAAGHVLVTDHQRLGRGRQSRVWHDEPGSSLLVSVLLRPERELAPLIPLVTGLAAVDAVGALDPARPDGAGGLVGLKWPNDVLAPGHGERKLAGILAEAETAASPAGWTGPKPPLTVVVGMGLNLRWPRRPPDDVAARAVTLSELFGRPVERDVVLDRFLAALERWLTVLEQGGPVLDAYRSACLTLGRSVRFTTSQGGHAGTAVDVTAGGALLLDVGDGPLVELHAGDAHHVQP